MPLYLSEISDIMVEKQYAKSRNIDYNLYKKNLEFTMKELRNDLTTGNNAGMPERLYVKSREESVCVSEWQHWWYPACMMLTNSI